MISGHFKTPQDVIQDYYLQKHLKAVTPQKLNRHLILARGNRKYSLRQLYLKEHLFELCFTEMARKNSNFCNGSNGTQLERMEK